MLKRNLHLCFSSIHCLPTPYEDAEKEAHQPQPIANPFTTLHDSIHSLSPTADTFPSAFASRRFFVSTPGTSNSILDSRRRPSAAVLCRSVPVRKYSPDPYMDFRASMEEMLNARSMRSVVDPSESSSDQLEYLHDLLLCYLSLNSKHAHKFIIGAFTDLLLPLVFSSGKEFQLQEGYPSS